MTDALAVAPPARRAWPALLAGSAAAALLALAADGMLAGVVCAFAMAAFLAGVFRPRLLVPLIAAGCAVLPPYVGWLLPGLGFANLQRGVMYGGALGLALWALRERVQGRWVLLLDWREIRWLRGAMLFLLAGWMVAPILALALGPGNSVKALNTVVYQALAFAVGLRFTRDLDGRRLLQLSFAALIVYVLPYWLYELHTGRGAFWWYVPPLPDLLTGQGEILRGGKIRVAATFGQPLAFSQFLVVTIPVALSLLYARFPRALTWAIAGIGVAAVVATRSRSPWGALVVAPLLLLIVRRRSLRAVVVVSLLAVTAVAIPLVGAIRSHALAREARSLLLERWSKQNEGVFSYVGRVFVVLGSLRVIKDQPLAGYGVNATATGAHLPSVDNYYMALAVEQGVVVAGLATLGVFLAWMALARRAVGGEAVWLVYAAGAYLAEWLFVGLHDTAPLFYLVLGHLFATAGSERVPAPAFGLGHLSATQAGRVNGRI